MTTIATKFTLDTNCLIAVEDNRPGERCGPWPDTAAITVFKSLPWPARCLSDAGSLSVNRQISRPTKPALKKEDDRLQRHVVSADGKAEQMTDKSG
ncbi:hypothetical protein [Rhizobium hidalgonense]|uniref:hypothetical protein n=1 Tax=Rhizobium hidalgonense TaxID=1538159 RepID=UPI0028710C01|nr:hypothetical protein [Rhizobium hidalgonense]MDR9814922.1 hypothetical protein [Rhizobium hidalgonense]